MTLLGVIIGLVLGGVPFGLLLRGLLVANGEDSVAADRLFAHPVTHREAG